MVYFSSYSWLLYSLSFSTAFAAYEQQGGVNNPNDPGLARYVSRPDLAAPIWDVKVYHEDLVNPGYWFISPYKALDAVDVSRAWVGPHIYDGRTGELVWSGSQSYYLSRGNIEDFKLSNVLGEDKLTLMHAATGNAVILGTDYQMEREIKIDEPGKVNTHEFHFVENGTRALVIKSHREEGTKDMSRRIGFEGRCVGQFDGFEEFDTRTWRSTFDWRSFGKVGFEESTLTAAPVERRCNNWDFIHANSVDKTPEGDYLWNSRHTDTIYKISGEDGHIIWRLGGKKSDFEHIGEDMIFSRQHDIRQRSKNETHTIITILDNAKGIDKQAPTADQSRGMRIALDEKNMTATVEAIYNHPDGIGAYAPRRGNYQILPNGNIFMGWSERAQQSEYTPDGKLVMEAILRTTWLGSYRNYKFPFVGHPVEPPVAHSQAYGTPNNATVTTVHVSWNGATEVAQWNLYRTVANGQINVLVATAERMGFETVMSYGGYASYIIAEAINKNGTVLGRTDVTETIAHANVTAEAVAEEGAWLQDLQDSRDDLVEHAKGMLTNPITAFVIGCVCTTIVVYLSLSARRRNIIAKFLAEFRGEQKYTPVPDGGEEADVPLHRLRKEGSPEPRSLP